MPLAVPDHVLTLPREQLTEFFLVFARFEFALKVSGYAKDGPWGSEVDWKTFAESIGAQLFAADSIELAGAINYLEGHPARRQAYADSGTPWLDRPAPKSYSRTRALLFYVQGVRNNLVHGNKFIMKETPDVPERDLHLLRSATAVLSAVLELSPATAQAFFE